MTADQRWPLGRYRIVDLSTGIAGPYCTRLLADFGADVVKIEPPEGDPTRRQGPYPDDVPDINRSGTFMALNATKRSVTLDLASPDGRAAALRLIDVADVVVESFGPGGMAALGLAPEELRGRNPGLVVTSLSGFGGEGPYRDYLTTTLVAHALGGTLYATGAPDREPVQPGVPLGFYIAGQFAAVGTLQALWHRRGGGRGQQVEVAVNEAIVATKIYDMVACSYTGQIRRRTGHRYAASSPLMVTLPCQVGHVGLHVVMPHQWRALCDFMGMPELADDPRFATGPARLEHGEEVERLLREFLARHTAAWLYHEGQARRIPFCMLPTVDEVLTSPQRRGRGYFVPLEDPSGARWEVPGRIAILPSMPARDLLRAPALGKHTEEVGRQSGKGEPDAIRRPVLTPLRVLDVSMGWAGPLAAQLLADMGAEVIKVESITRPDWWRGQVIDAAPESFTWEMSPMFNGVNGGKLGVTLDLRHPRGHQIFRDLATRSDVLIENFSPGVMDRLGLGWDVLHAGNPRLVMLSMPVNGLDGPERDYVGFGMNVEAMAGVTQLAGYEDGPPQMMPNALGDPVSGLNGALAVLAALHERELTGAGQHVELAQVEGLIPFIADALLEYQMTGRIRRRTGNRHPAMAPHGVYPCSRQREEVPATQHSDEWVAVAVEHDGQWEALRRALGDPAWAADARFATTRGRLTHQDAIDGHLAAWTAERDKRQAMEHLQAFGVPAGAVLTDADLLADPHLAARGFFQAIDRAFVGTHLYPGPAIRMSDESPRPRPPAPTLGEHNMLVLRDILGLDEAAVAELEHEGVIGALPSRVQALARGGD